MANSATLNGVTYTDDSDPSTGLANGGHRERLIPMFSNAIINLTSLKDLTQAASAAALASSTATLWVSGVDGLVGEVKISPINLLPYRRKNTGAFTTDPSLDATNWEPQAYDLSNDVSPQLGGSLDANTYKITNAGNPSNPQDLTTLAMVQTMAQYF